MLTHLQKTPKGLAIILPPELVEELQLEEGATLHVAAFPKTEANPVPRMVFATTPEALAAYQKTL